MQVQQICAILVLWLVAIEGKNQVIQCYVCDDCDIVDDCLLESCPPDFEVSTAQTSTSIATTSRPPTATQSTPTSSSSSTSTSTLTSTSNMPTTSLTTEPPYPTSMIPTAETEQTSQTETTFTSETGVTSDTSTSAPITDPSSTTSTSTDARTSTQIQLTRNITRASLASTVSYHCYSIDVFENYKQKTKRGCVEVPEEESACAVLRKGYGCSSKNCKVCSTDRCNSNGALRGSLLAVIAITLFGFLSEKMRCERS